MYFILTWLYSECCDACKLSPLLEPHIVLYLYLYSNKIHKTPVCYFFFLKYRNVLSVSSVTNRLKSVACKTFSCHPTCIPCLLQVRECTATSPRLQSRDHWETCTVTLHWSDKGKELDIQSLSFHLCTIVVQASLIIIIIIIAGHNVCNICTAR